MIEDKKVKVKVEVRNEERSIIQGFKPEILAPAGDTQSFLAALGAGADAIYVGMKHFSARAGADNFSTTELAKMKNLAHKKNAKLYIAFNSLVKSDDLLSAGRLLARLARDVQPDALILQEAGLIDIARQAGFTGEAHLSTLANVTHPLAIEVAKSLGASRVIIPREASIDEIRVLAQKCPEGVELELFVHGALCYCVSGRCYWSSLMGGKSGLRGRCVQPCRRVYKQNKREGRFFSCQDLSLDVLVKTLLSEPKVASWKIEGRKKGPHYVYHAVAAYKLLRDNPSDPKAKKDAEDLLEMSLGRPRTHANFLPQTKEHITAPDDQTSSGLLIGKVQVDGKGASYIKPYINLVPKDLLRVGFEDDASYSTLPIQRFIPKAGAFNLSVPRHKTPKAGTQIFLIDRREDELSKIIQNLEKELNNCRVASGSDVDFVPKLAGGTRFKRGSDILLRASQPQGKETRGPKNAQMALWLTARSAKATSKTICNKISWWLPPVIWTNEEDNFQRSIIELLRNGATDFVCNAPYQLAFFKDLARVNLIAGPFCNLSNAASLVLMKNMGFKGAIVSPELNKEDFLVLPSLSPLPLGIVLSGHWPAGIARQKLFGLKSDESFQSPKGEDFWSRMYGQNLWIYPSWTYDIKNHRAELEAAGYNFFVEIQENAPLSAQNSRRASSSFNWDIPLL